MEVTAAPERIQLKPHSGAQVAFLSSSADVVWFGGAAGPGKTWCLLFAAMRHMSNPQWRAGVFRRTYPQITMSGGTLDEARKLYPLVNASMLASPQAEARFPSGARIQFRALQYETDVKSYQGSQWGMIAFDELTHFTERQFTYLVTRLRAPVGSGTRPQFIATMNPPDFDDPDTKWMYDFVLPYLYPVGHPLAGFPNPAMSGRIRWFTRVDDVRHWADTREELTSRFPESVPLSFSFIPATLADNPSIADEYRGKLQQESKAEQQRLLHGNWFVSTSADFFKDARWKYVDVAPRVTRWVRYWDFAATEATDANPNPDATSGALVGMTDAGELVIADIENEQASPARIEQMVTETAHRDGYEVTIGIEEEKGSSGKLIVASMQRGPLLGYEVIGDPPTGDKSMRAAPWRTMAEQGRVILVRGAWNARFIGQTRRFPKRLRDDIDAVSGGFKMLIEGMGGGDISSGYVEDEPMSLKW